MLKENALYFGDNGRITCGALKCAGMSAHFSGRTISGQKVAKVKPAEVALLAAEGFPAKCECCGRVA